MSGHAASLTQLALIFCVCLPLYASKPISRVVESKARHCAGEVGNAGLLHSFSRIAQELHAICCYHIYWLSLRREGGRQG